MPLVPKQCQACVSGPSTNLTCKAKIHSVYVLYYKALILVSFDMSVAAILDANLVYEYLDKFSDTVGGAFMSYLIAVIAFYLVFLVLIVPAVVAALHYCDFSQALFFAFGQLERIFYLEANCDILVVW